MSSDRTTYTYKFLNNYIHRLGNHFRKINFPGSSGLSLYEVTTFFIRGLKKGSLNLRATSIAFHFLLALGPAIIFLIGLIPYFRSEFSGRLDGYPGGCVRKFLSTAGVSLNEIFNKHHGLQIFGFLVTLFFVQKGLNGIIEAFNATYHTVGSRPWMNAGSYHWDCLSSCLYW
jgi:membrane protein